MITSNVIHRVFRIRHGASEATAFTLEIDDKEYLVTAKHVVKDFTNGQTIDVFGNTAWQPREATLVGHAEGERDISVLALKTVLTPPGLPMPSTSSGVIYGQDVFFLGFPYGFVGHYAFGPEGFPLPFVKRATLSLVNRETFLLDGHNNPGFSGGPVIFREPGKVDLNVCAVISGFRAVDEPVYVGNSPVYAGAGEPVVFRYNTGIILTWRVDFAVALIKANPIGVARSGAG